MSTWRGEDALEKEFLKIFNSLNPSLNGWQIWEYVISAMACGLANVIDPDDKRKAKREEEYARSMKQLNGNVEAVGHLLAIMVEHFEEYPEEDFLGKMYMNLNLGNHWTGQFFTPMSISLMMAEVTIPDDAERKLEDRDYISVCDPSCGAGVNLLAAARVLRQRKVNYQQKCVFVGQDIDRVVAQMCFIQLAVIGAAGYVCVANTLTNPIVGKSDLIPHEREGQEFWYTPMYWTDTWQLRIFKQHLGLKGGPSKIKPLEKEHFYFYFDNEKENEDGREFADVRDKRAG